MKSLDNVTLICVEGRYGRDMAEQVIKVLKYCTKKIKFGEIVFVSPKVDDDILNKLQEENITHHEIEPMDWLQYGAWSIQKFYEHVNLDYALTVSRDGFILNPHLWDDAFLDYDYIGAKWCKYHLATCKWIHPGVREKGPLNLVGNSGFCLRSKKFLLETAKAPFPVDGPDDAYMCNNYKEYFLSKGIKYGTEEIADKFSREMNKTINFADVFGFHGEWAFVKNL
jgi:hypothetical protein